MIYRQLFDRLGKGQTVRAGIIGAGDFATAVVTQSAAIRRLDLPIVADIDVDLGRRAFLLAGYGEEEVVVCSSRSAVLQAVETGRRVVVQDAMLLMDVPLDVVIECTGVPEAAARHAEEAIRHGKHVANVTKEMNVLVGPILKHLADRAGLVYSTVDGDQPGLLIGLVQWAWELGLEVIAAGKSLGDVVYDQATNVVTDWDRSFAVDAAGAELLGPIAPGKAPRTVPARTALMQGSPALDAYELVEMAMVANATGLMPEVEGLYAPLLRTPEIPEVFCPVDEGGILHRRGVVDAAYTLRGPHEAGLGGGVWIVVACDNDYSRNTLATKGLIVNSRGSAMLIYRPHHLCGVEAPMSALCAGLLRVPTGASELRPLVDVVARATRDLAAGEKLDCDAKGSDLKASMRAAGPVEAGQPLPIYMAHRVALKVDVPAGTSITADMVVPPAGSRLWALRAEQDRLFFPSAG